MFKDFFNIIIKYLKNTSYFEKNKSFFDNFNGHNGIDMFDNILFEIDGLSKSDFDEIIEEVIFAFKNK